MSNRDWRAMEIPEPFEDVTIKDSDGGVNTLTINEPMHDRRYYGLQFDHEIEDVRGAVRDFFDSTPSACVTWTETAHPFYRRFSTYGIASDRLEQFINKCENRGADVEVFEDRAPLRFDPQPMAGYIIVEP